MIKYIKTIVVPSNRGKAKEAEDISDNMSNQNNNTDKENKPKNRFSLFTVSILFVVAVCFAVLAVREYRPFRQLSNISFESMAKKVIENNVDSLSAFFALSNDLMDSLLFSMPLIPKNHITEISRTLRQQIDESSVQGVFLYLEDKDINKRRLRADSVRLFNPVSRPVRDVSWQPDSGWSGYLHRGARIFVSPERRSVRTYYEWFKNADSASLSFQHENKKEWIGPVFDETTKSRIIYMISPVDVGEQRGFIFIAHSVNMLFTYMQSLGISRYGSPYIIDDAGNYIVNAPDLNRKRQLGQYINEFVFKIPNISFDFGAAIYSGDSQEFGAYQEVMRKIFFRMMAYIVLSIILFLFCVKIMFKPARTLIYFLVPVCLLVSIIINITAFYRFPGSNSGRITANDFDEHLYSERDKKTLNDNGIDFKWNPALVIDQKAVDFFVNRYQNRSDLLYGSQARIIPTGIMINAIRFTEPSVVVANGFVWQKFLITNEQYPRQIMRKYQYDTYRNKGIDFFGGVRDVYYGGAFSLVDSIETTMDGYKALLMRWSFVVDLEQVPSYGLYPFGIYNMAFTIKGKNNDDNTMLVPDMTAYNSMFPIDKPGIDNRLKITGWNVLQSSYSYRFGGNTSNLGNVNSQSRAPDISMNLFISTKFIDILVSKLLSVMVIVTLLFVLIFIRDKDNILDTVLGCSGLFFALVLDHVNLRERVQSTDVMYLEFIYLTVYGFLLLTILSAIYLKKIDDSNIDNMNSFMKNYFWIAFFGVMAISTMWRFY